MMLSARTLARNLVAVMLSSRRISVPKMEAVGADTRFAILTGRVLAPGSTGGGLWDERCAAMPIVLPPSTERKRWQCFYYGRPADRWNADLPAFLPTGVSGLAESDDGLNWSRVNGPLEEGAVFRPSENPDAFDYVHVGMTDVFALPDGAYAALYLGGSAEEISLGMGPGPIKGFKMRPGAATSRNGLEWARAAANPLLDVGADGAWDCNFCSWPRALPLDPSKPDGGWLMTYHALMPPGQSDGADGGASPPRWAVGAAICESGSPLGPYTKIDGNPVLSPGANGAFDEAGIGTRHVVHSPGGDGFVMVYEGVGGDGRHRLGLATSADGMVWAKVDGLGPDPGGPIFEGAPAESDAWDNGNVGTPWLVRLSGGGWRLYYVGTSSKGRTVSIGAAESQELLSSTWTRVGVSSSGLYADEVDAAGETPLILAAERADLSYVEALLAAGADVRAESYSGWTAAHGAAECGSVDVLERLAAAGADLSARAASGKTPLDIATQYEQREAAAALRAFGEGAEGVAANEDAEAASEAAAAALDVEALKRGLSELKRREAEEDVQQWKAAFGETAEISDASPGDADEGGEGYEIVGTF
jgi:hypothetical protein